ncbi:MAG: thiamine pyrophosphate-dependent enzyme, partial [Limisphaerales bacterium]
MADTVTLKKTNVKGRPVEKLLFGLEVMFQTRAVEAALKRRTDMARQVVGKVYGSLGEEAVGIGSVLALNKDDLISPLIRNLSAVLARQVPLASIFANCFGKKESPTKGRDANINASWPEHGILSRISLLATMVPVLNGWAYWQNYTKTGRVALTWLGDGGVSLGDFHEGLNFAAVLRSPLVVVVQNNQIALGTSLKNQTRNARFIDRAIGYGIPGLECDGNDLFDVWEKVEQAVKTCRQGEGPALVVAETYRRSAHNLTDLKTTEKLFPEVLAKGLAHDPVEFLISELEKEGVAGREELMARKFKIEEEVEAAALDAEKLADPEPGSHTLGIWAPWVPTAHTGAPSGPPRKYFDAINEALDLALKEKSNVLVLGEDVGHYEGA